jgi:hypothetical protein
VHKDKYFFKFGYDPNAFLSNIVDALASLKEYCVLHDIKRLALVRIASNTERVHWRWTQMKLLEIFSELEITLVIYLHKLPKKFFHETTSTPADAPAVTDLRTGPLLEDAALRLADLESGEGNVQHKGSVGGGSLPMLPLPNQKPPRQPFPTQVKEGNGSGAGKTNPGSAPRQFSTHDGRKNGRSDGRTRNRGQPAAETRDTLPKRLSGGGGQPTLPPPPREPPLTNTRQKVISGGNGSSKANVLFSPRMSAANTNDLSDVVLLLREEISQIRTEFADLRRSVTPCRPDSLRISKFLFLQQVLRLSHQETEVEAMDKKHTATTFTQCQISGAPTVSYCKDLNGQVGNGILDENFSILLLNIQGINTSTKLALLEGYLDSMVK